MEGSNSDSATTTILRDNAGANVFVRNSNNLKITCTDPAHKILFKNHCGYATDDGGWKLVRHVPNGKTWHTAVDKLTGTEVYGNLIGGPQGSSAWSIKFEATMPGFDEFLFASGDCKHWLISSKLHLFRKGTLSIKFLIFKSKI